MNSAPTMIAPKKAMLELNAIFENATVGILFTHNRKLMQANRLCAEMFGYALAEFLGQSALILYESAEAYSALGREAGPVLSRGESFKAETRLKRRDGSLFWCRVSAKAIDPEHPRDGTLVDHRGHHEPTARCMEAFAKEYAASSRSIFNSRPRWA
jgi:PAS domain S-box-containing protein